MHASKVVLITGQWRNGSWLDTGSIKQADTNIVAGCGSLDRALRNLVSTYIVGDVLDQMLLGRLVVEHEIAIIYHLASILSTKAEYNPETAHRINVEGT